MEVIHRAVPDVGRAYWLIRLRWIGTLGVVLTTLVSSRLLGVSLHCNAIYAVCAVLAGYNLMIWWWAKGCPRDHTEQTDARIRKAIRVQICMDLVCLTLLLHFSGGIENPFMFFFMFHMIIASILLSVGESYMTATLAVLLFGLTVVLEHLAIIHHYCLRGFVSQCAQHRPLYALGTFLVLATSLYLAVYMTSDIARRRRQAEQALRVSHDYLAGILDSMYAGLMVIDADLVIIDVNRRMLEQCGARREDVIGRKCFEISHYAEGRCSDSEDVCPARQVFATGQRARVEHTHLDSVDGAHAVELSAFPLLGPDGQVTSVVELSYDITERKQAEEALREANVQLRQKDRIKDEYVRRVTHDIKGHLGAVQTCLELVTGGLLGPLNERQTDFLGRAQARTKSLVRFLKTLLRLSEIRLCDELDMALFSLKDSLHRVTTKMETRARDRSIDLSCQIESDADALFGNAVLIEEAVTHLLLNAVKYTPEHGSITVTAGTEGPDLHITVADTGMGISQTDLDRIFEEFFRASNAKAAKTTSTGLGLSIVHQIVKKHGGHIDVQSQEGRGTSFRITLPRRTEAATKGWQA